MGYNQRQTLCVNAGQGKRQHTVNSTVTHKPHWATLQHLQSCALTQATYPLKEHNLSFILNTSPLTDERNALTLLGVLLLPHGTGLWAPAFCGSAKSESPKLCWLHGQANWAIGNLTSAPGSGVTLELCASDSSAGQADSHFIHSKTMTDIPHLKFMAEQKQRGSVLFKKTVLQTQLSLLPLHKT